MDNIAIDVGIKRLTINDDPTRIIEFNPSDVIFAEKFYKLIKDFEQAQFSYEQKAEKLDKNKEKDENGLPKNLSDRIALLREVCEFMRSKIDELFGEGSSQAAFEDALSLVMFEQFFAGITPYIQDSRAKKLAKYNPPPSPNSRKRKVKMT